MKADNLTNSFTPTNNQMMDTSTLTLESLVSKNMTKEAISQLKVLITSLQDQLSSLTTLEGRYVKNDRDKIKDVEDSSNIKREYNQIDYAFLNILAEIRNEIQSKMTFYKSIPKAQGDEDIMREFLNTVLVKKYDDIKYFAHGNAFIYFQAKERSSDLNVIVMMLKSSDIKSIMDNRYLQRIAQLKHRNLIQLLDSNLQSYPYYIITESVTGIDLKTLMKNIGALPLHNAKKLLLIIGDVINTLKIKKFPFVGIRPTKILIDQELQPEISPFDILTVDSNQRLLKTFVEDCQYLSNETLFEIPYAKKCEFSKDNKCHFYTGKDKPSKDCSKHALKDKVKCEYMKLTSPDSVDRAGQFSLAALGYEMITGTKLFDGDNLSELLLSRHRFFTEEKVRNSKFNHPLLPKRMADIFKKMLSKDPQKRYDDMPTALKEIAKVQDKLDKNASIVFKSYLRCLHNTDDFINKFYENLFNQEEMVALKAEYEKDEKKQELLKKFYVDINMVFGLQNFDTFVEKLTTVKPNEINPLCEYSLYLDAFTETIEDSDPHWSYKKEVKPAWEAVKAKVLEKLKNNLPKPEMPSNNIPDDIINLAKSAGNTQTTTHSQAQDNGQVKTKEDVSFDNKLS